MPKARDGFRRYDIEIPSALAQRLEALLHSDVLGRIPRGSINQFFVHRLNDFLGRERLPLGHYAGFASDDFVEGPPATIRKVALALEELRQAPDGLDEAFPELNPLKR